jgi:hypothetical protein
MVIFHFIIISKQRQYYRRYLLNAQTIANNTSKLIIQSRKLGNEFTLCHIYKISFIAKLIKVLKSVTYCFVVKPLIK